MTFKRLKLSMPFKKKPKKNPRKNKKSKKNCVHTPVETFRITFRNISSVVSHKNLKINKHGVPKKSGAEGGIENFFGKKNK